MMQLNLKFKYKDIRAKVIFSILTLGLILFSFQNCIGPGFYSITEESLAACIDPSCDDYRTNSAYCEFNGTLIRNSQSFKAFLSSNGSCQSEDRTCVNGTLTGSYPFAFCTPGETVPGACIFGNKTIANGQSVTAYLNGSGNCDYERRTCNNGVLSGSYPYASCNSGTGEANCLFNGQTIKHGSVVRAFQNSTVTTGETCIEELRLCTNGVLSGNYQHPFCAVNVPRTCLFNNTVVPHQGQITTFESSTVPYGTTCKSQTRTCNNGALTGTYFFTSCNVGNPKSCILDGRLFSHGSNMEAFSAEKEDGTCDRQVRKCTNGKFNGDNRYKYVVCGNSGGNDPGDGSGGTGGSTPSTGGDGGGGSNGSYQCANNEIFVGNKCIAAHSTCTATDKALWKNLAKSGDERASVAWMYCEFIGVYRSRQHFDQQVSLRRYSPSQYCPMTLTNFLLWEKCKTKQGDDGLPVCHDSATALVNSAYQMALGRLPVSTCPNNQEWCYTEFQRELSSWNRRGATDTSIRAQLYMMDMCNKAEFKNRHKDYL